ncbi:MAG: DUF1730 domain-containing protein [Clostridia bacterium]|nr:DUF1730 domain-containing protein [Clostridia bacterium]
MTLESIFSKEQILEYSVLPMSECDIRRRDLIERRGVDVSSVKTAIVFLMPYNINDGDGNVSRYARPKDYHFYFDGLKERLEPELEKAFGGRFMGFSDVSPIEETTAALKSGLGVRGDSYVILNERYGSYVFIGEFITTLDCETFGIKREDYTIKTCEHCGLCRKSCPMTIDNMGCLSAITQKKGELKPEEIDYIKKYPYVWGCDICQDVCPHNKGVEETPIEFFKKDRIKNLSLEILDSMDDKEFYERAFSWRKRETIRRNIFIKS